MTVYEAYDQPSGRSHPIMEIVSGGRRLEVADTTPDGGMGFSISPSACGRPVKPESVPTAMTFPGNRKTQDLEAMFVYTVSERLKDLIEEIEPGTHQFLPVTIVKKKSGEFLESRWFWQVCNRIDSVLDGEPGWFLQNGVWQRPSGSRPVFDLAKIGEKHFWRDKHLICEIMMSEFALARLNEEDMSGFRIIEHAARTRSSAHL